MFLLRPAVPIGGGTLAMAVATRIEPLLVRVAHAARERVDSRR